MAHRQLSVTVEMIAPATNLTASVVILIVPPREPPDHRSGRAERLAATCYLPASEIVRVDRASTFATGTTLSP
jgi:hypothetical protein